MSLRNLKVGDEVYVVPQTANHHPRKSSIVRIGRKYGYVTGPYANSGEQAFILDTGESFCGDPEYQLNHRVNKFGFDVYISESHYASKVNAESRMAELRKRLMGSYTIKDLPSHVVEELHSVLDRMGV